MYANVRYVNHLYYLQIDVPGVSAHTFLLVIQIKYMLLSLKKGCAINGVQLKVVLVWIFSLVNVNSEHINCI